MITGNPNDPRLREIDPDTKQQKAHVALPAEERERGFVRPLRTSYIHEKCGTVTTMPLACAETYARRPTYYSGTFCCGCSKYLPVGPEGEFVWNDEKREKVGT